MTIRAETIIPAVSLLLLLFSGALADEGTVSTDWISTQWDIWCPSATSPDAGPCDEYETATRVFKDYLESASEWYKGLGFMGPKVFNKLGRYHAHVVHPDDAQTADGTAFSGIYDPNAKLIVLNGDDFFAMGDPGETTESAEFRVQQSYIYTSVHELFHAIEATYSDHMCGEGRGWLCEGMADAALRAYADKFEPEVNIAMQRRPYHEPLHQPSDKNWGYGTWQFWLDVGDYLNSTDRIRYFRNVMERDLRRHQGLVGVDHALKDIMTNNSDEPAIRDPAGLYELLPWFFAKRDPGTLFPSPLRNTVRLEQDQNSAIEHLKNITIRPVAGRSVELTVIKPAGKPVAIKISFAEPNEDLHLIVNKRRFDKVRGNNRNVFFDIDDEAQEMKFDVVIANVAKAAQMSGEVKVDIIVELLTEFASMGMTAASDTVVETGIDLDRINMSYIIPALTELQAQAGFSQPCALRLAMSSSRTGDVLELHMDHEGPISPGAFPVVSLQKGRYQPPEDHPDKFVVSFGIGKENITSGGYDQAYGARSGFVVIEDISQTFIQGSVEVVGERQINGKYIGDDWVDFPANLATVPMAAKFRLIPKLPLGVGKYLSLDSCFDTSSEQEVTVGGGSNPPISPEDSDKDGGTEGQGETSEQASGQPDDDIVVDENEPPSAPNATGEDVASKSDASEPGLINVDPECRPLYFATSEVFSDNPDLPFAFKKPQGWDHDSDGGNLRGTVHPPEYRDSGIQYNARWSRNDADAAMADRLHKAGWEKIDDLQFGGSVVDVHGGQLGDAINTYAILPIGDRRLILEVRFLGRRACSADPLETLRALFWESVTPIPARE